MFSSVGPSNNCKDFLRAALILTALLSLFSGTLSYAAETMAASSLQVPTIPPEYGRIVYQKNGQCPQQIYIIGQSHRSALTGRSGSDTVKVQSEIYRIGEWLIREQNVELLLPEGFFQKSPRKQSFESSARRETALFDNQTLEAALSDSSRVVNADLLLNASYKIRLGQIEDEPLYRDIRRLLREAHRSNSLYLLSKLDGLQDKRTATLLQNIPDVVEKSFRTGRIENRKAIFTIGLAHLNEIINILQHGSLPPAADLNSGPMQGHSDEESLKLLDQGYGVTVIIPRILAENQQILRLCKLDREGNGAPDKSAIAPGARQIATSR